MFYLVKEIVKTDGKMKSTGGDKRGSEVVRGEIKKT